MRINFERIEVFQNIDHSVCTVQNVKKDFANVIYNFGAGLPSLALALKIYNSHGEEEYSDEECQLIRKVSERCNPAFIDAMRALLDVKKD